MEQVRSIVKSAGRRLFVNDFVQALAITLSIGIGLVLLARIVERVLGLTTSMGPHWRTVFIAVASAAVVSALGWAFVIRRKTMQVAQEVDARADLKESLSTALAIESDIKAHQPWAVAVAETATTAASKVRVPVVVPYETPPAWPAPVLGGIALAVIWYALPNFDLLKIDAPKLARKQKEAEVLQVKTEMAKDKEKLKELLSKAKVDVMEGKGEPLVPEQAQKENDPDAIKRAALKELTDLTNKLEDAKVSEKAMQSEAIKEAMEQLKQPGEGPLNELAKSLQKGDFSGAKDQLDQLTKQMQSGDMSPEKKEELKKQMENLGKQLKELSKDQKALEKKLQDAGLDKKTAEAVAKAASDPSKLKDELSKMPGMNEQMKNELMKIAQANSECQGQCNKMGESMSKMGESMSKQGMGQQGAQAMDELKQALSDGEMMQADMENLNAALDEAKDQMAKLGQDMQKMGKKSGSEGECEGEGEGEGSGKLGEWRAGDSNKKGKGSGNAGQGDGRSPEAQASDYALDKKKADVKTTKGAVIGSRLVYGEQVKGEAIAEFADAVASGEQTAAEGMEAMKVPKELEGAVKQYFGRLKDKVEQGKKDAKPAGK